MTKQELFNEIDKIDEANLVVFVEILDTGETNRRTMGCSRHHTFEVINQFFDDNLKGHFRDGVGTTIIGVTSRPKI